MNTRNLPAGTPFALRVFGHKQADACRTDLEIALAPLDVASAVSRIAVIEAKNLAKTPIADSLRAVEQDLAGTRSPRIIVLVTDGEETCDGDPAAAIERLKKAGFDVRVNVVGFAIDELMLKREFESWARLGGGHYFDAVDGDSLSAAVQQSLRVPYEVLDGDETVATGMVDGDAIAVPAGNYRVRVFSTPVVLIDPVVVESGAEVDVRVE